MMNREYNANRERHESYYISNGDESKVNDGWQELVDPESGAHYYWNEFSGETTWDPPSRFQAGQVDHETVQVAKPVGFSDVYAALLNMGFPPESIVATMNEAQGNISYDDLVAKLSMVHDSGSSVDGGVNAAIPVSTNQTMADYLILFVKEILSSGEESSHELLHDAAMDLSAKIHMAVSVLKTFDEDDDSSEQVINLISWAKDMKQFHSDLVYAFDENIPFKLMTEHYGAGLIAWYKDLEVTRSTVDENCASSNVISDKELQRIAELKKIAG